MGEAVNLVNNFKVEKVIFNCGEFNELEKELIKVLDKKKIKYYSCIKELNKDKYKLMFLNTKEYDNENDNSNVIYTELGGYKFMFMGDAGIEKEKDILDKYNVKTTFFLVGDWVEKYPESVKEISKRGHDVGNHSNTHPHMTQMSVDDMNMQIQTCNEKIKALTGKCPTLFRAPYGDYNNDVVKTVKANNMYCVQWDVDSLDWKDPTPNQITLNITNKLKDGSIILMHNGATNTPEALPMVIEAIKAQGYEIVPISQILLKGNYTTDVQGKMLPAQNATS